MATFGNDNKEGNSWTINNRMEAGIFTCPETGTADAIRAYLNVSGGTVEKAKAALYKTSDDTLLGGTEEKTLSAGDQIVTFNFSAPKPSLENIEYAITVWAKWLGNNIYLWKANSGGSSRYENATYDGWETPWTGYTAQSELKSICCDYTPSGAPTGQPYISRVQRVTGMRSWGGISSFHKRFPAFKPRVVT